MKKTSLIGKIALLSLALSVMVTGVKAANYTISSNNVASGISLLVPPGIGAGGLITSVTIVNTNANTFVTSKLYDSRTNLATFVLAAYSNVVYSATSTTNIYTNVFGTITTNTPYNTVTRTISSVAQTTNNYPVLLTTVVGTNNTTYTFTGGIPFYQGLSFSNSAICNIIVNYSR